MGNKICNCSFNKNAQFEEIFPLKSRNTFTKNYINEYILSNINILTNDFFEKSRKFEFEEIVEHLQSLNTELVSFDTLEKHLSEMETYDKYKKPLMFSEFKTNFIIEKYAELKNEQLTIKEIYDFYLKNYFNHQKSKQLLTLKLYNEEEQKTKNYFVKVLNIDFTFEAILKSVKESEKTFKDEFFKIIGSLSITDSEEYKESDNEFNDIPIILRFFLSIKKYKSKVIKDILEINVNLQKDILKELLLKLSLREKSKVTICKSYYVDYKNKKIYLIHKLYENNILDVLSNNQSDLPYERKLALIKNVLNTIESIHADNIVNLNITLENIKITHKNTIKLASLKNGIKNGSENEFLIQVYSKFHFCSFFNSKIHFPPEFYDLKNKTVINFSQNYEETAFKVLSGIDVWSFGVIMAYAFTNKNNLQTNSTKMGIKTNAIEISYNSRNNLFENCDLIDIFYRQMKILPEALFRNIICKNNYIKSIVIGIIRYQSRERPTLRDIIYLLENL